MIYRFETRTEDADGRSFSVFGPFDTKHRSKAMSAAEAHIHTLRQIVGLSAGDDVNVDFPNEAFYRDLPYGQEETEPGLVSKWVLDLPNGNTEVTTVTAVDEVAEGDEKARQLAEALGEIFGDGGNVRRGISRDGEEGYIVDIPLGVAKILQSLGIGKIQQ